MILVALVGLAIAGVAVGVGGVELVDRLPTGESRRDGALAGAVASAGAVLVDVVATGGDLIVGLALVAVDQISVILALVAETTRLSDRIPWIPAGAAESALAVVAALFVVVTAVRLVRRGIDRLSN